MGEFEEVNNLRSQDYGTVRDLLDAKWQDEIRMREMAERELSRELSTPISIPKNKLSSDMEVEYNPDDLIEIKIEEDEEGNPQWFIRNKTLSEAEKKDPPEGVFEEIKTEDLQNFIDKVDPKKIAIHKLVHAVRISEADSKNSKLFGYRLADGSLGGIVSLNEVTSTDGYINVLATDPKAQQSGVGTAMLSELKNKYSSLRLSASPFSVTDNNSGDEIIRLKNFYKANGFVAAQNWSKNQISLDDRQNAGNWQKVDDHNQVGSDFILLDKRDLVTKTMQHIYENQQLRNQLSPDTQITLGSWNVVQKQTKELQAQLEQIRNI